MMKGQARASGLVMGFDTRMIAGVRACFTSTQPITPTITSQTSPHYAEALGQPACKTVLPCGELGRAGSVPSTLSLTFST
jgi:hypothetical protein